MAVDYTVRYPGQVDVPGAQYPYGRARNVDSPGSGDGTPFEKDLVNDIFGLQQALLLAAGITPSGTPDRADVSQYMEAIRRLTRRIGCNVVVSGSNIAEDGFFGLAIDNQTTGGGFTISGGNNLVLPDEGLYYAALQLPVLQTVYTLNAVVEARIDHGITPIKALATRWTATTLVPITLIGQGMILNTGGANTLRVQNKEAQGGLMDVQNQARLTVFKVSGGNVAAGW